MLMQTSTGRLTNRFGELQIAVGEGRASVPHVACQPRERGLSTAAGGVPPPQGLDREAVALMPSSA